MFQKRKYYFQICFQVGDKGQSVAIVVDVDKPFVSIPTIRNAAKMLHLGEDSVPSNVFCYGRMTEKEWKEYQ